MRESDGLDAVHAASALSLGGGGETLLDQSPGNRSNPRHRL